MAKEPVRLTPVPDRHASNSNSGDHATGGATPPPLDDPALFEGTVGRRIFAYLIDIAILFALTGAVYALVAITFGLLAFVLPFLVLLPLAYHTLTIASSAQATIGQRMLGLKVVSLWGHPPSLPQVAIQVVLFYLSLSLTSGLILLWALFDDRNRCLHDILSGTMTVRADRIGL